MIGHVFRFLTRYPSTKPLFVAISLCAFLAFAVRADERPAKSRAGLPNTSDAAANSAKPTKEHIEQLIRNLGSAQYTARRAAASELRQIGAEAFDLLFAATDDA